MKLRAIETLKDINDCTDLAVDYFICELKSGYSQLTLVESKLYNSFLSFTQSYNMFFDVVIEDNKIIGFMITSREDAYWSDDKYHTDVLTYVLPQYRGTKAFSLLLATAKRRAKDEGVMLQLAGLGGLEEANAVYEKRFLKAGSVYHTYI